MCSSLALPDIVITMPQPLVGCWCGLLYNCTQTNRKVHSEIHFPDSQFICVGDDCRYRNKSGSYVYERRVFYRNRKFAVCLLCHFFNKTLHEASITNITWHCFSSRGHRSGELANPHQIWVYYLIWWSISVWTAFPGWHNTDYARGRCLAVSLDVIVMSKCGQGLIDLVCRVTESLMRDPGSSAQEPVGARRYGALNS